MSLKSVRKLLLVFTLLICFFLIFFSLFRATSVLAISLGDIEYCGVPPGVCAFKDRQGSNAKCVAFPYGGYYCEKDYWTVPMEPCCPNWTSGCNQINFFDDCTIVPPNPPYDMGSCTTTSEGERNDEFAAGGGEHVVFTACSPVCYTSGTSCAAQGGTCGNPGNCNGTLQTGLCPGGSDCVCCIPLSVPDCGSTCLSHGTASVSWPDCFCTNRSPASGYERIGTWNTSDCSQCTGYRQVGCSCGDWVAGSCGAGSCSSSERRYTRTCTPSGCSSEVNCAYDASCGGSPPTSTPTPTNTPAPPPATCTVSLDPSSLILNVGESDLLTANVSVQNGSVSQVNFSSNNPDVASVDPSSDGDSPYRTQVTGEDQGGAQVSASVSLSPSGSCSTSTPANITVTAAGWFQTQGGTIHAEGNLLDDIPEDAIDKNLSISQYGFPGVISHQSATGVNLGEGYPSSDEPDHWLANSSYQGKNFSSWTFFEKKYAAEMGTEDFDDSLPGTDGIYYSSSDKTLQGSWNLPAGRWVLVLVDGNITVPTDISVPEGSFLGLVSSGDINFTDDVSQVEGVFIANNSINTGASNSQFQGEGFFAASQFVLSRDLEDDNPTTPGELFVFRPDFLINSYKDADYNLWWLEFRWEEIAP